MPGPQSFHSPDAALIKFKGDTWERFGEILSGDVGG